MESESEESSITIGTGESVEEVKEGVILED